MEELFGVYVGRLNPIHLGHQRTIDRMIAETKNACLLVLGSANAPFSDRNFFDLEERTELIKLLYPGLPIVGIPDFGNLKKRNFALDQLISLAHPGDKKNVVYYGGTREDVDFFHKLGRKTVVVDRFAPGLLHISGTQVREALQASGSLDGLVDHSIQDKVVDLFHQKLARVA